jgi:betaine-aldehyde dehydrogenase
VGQRLAEHEDVNVISFTGSTPVGQRIVTAAAGNLKRVSLELGGKNPQIVFPDADLDAVLNAVVLGGYFNAGECCNSGSRVLLHRDVPDDFVAALAERARALRVGDPLDSTTKVGAIIERRQFDKIMGHIAAGRQQGARLRAGGDAIERGAGLFIAPTVFDQVSPEMRMAREEIFGPVISILRFGDEAEAARIANSTSYGLSAAIWSRDFDRVTSLARRIRAGTVWINCFLDGFPEVPFGGYRQSGWGRELGRGAVEHYCETKSVVARLGPAGPAWDQP